MYRIYHTEGLILGSRAVGEASKIISFLTKDFGFIEAHVQSVREGKSKLRYSLQDFSLALLDVVRGKGGWRITSAAHKESLARFPEPKIKESWGVAKRISALLVRLLRGEEKDEALFYETLSFFRALKNEAIPAEATKNLEALFLVRVLKHLGYFGEDDALAPFLGDFEIGEARTLLSFAPLRGRAVRRINESLRETQL